MKKKRLKKIITWVVVICVIAAGGGAGYWWYNKDDTAAAAPAFQQARVTQGTITQSVSGSGSVAVSETEDAIVSEAGTIDQVKVKEGDEVKKGDVLATFEGEDVSLDLNKAKLNLEQQQMQLEQAQEKWKSLQVSGADESDLESAEMSIKSVQLNIEQTQLEIQDYEDKAKAPDPIVAPIDGTITAADVKAGDQVQARLTAFTLVNYNKLEVSISADELDITKIKVGQSANVSIEALSGQKITGKVTEISKDGTSSNGVATFPVIVTLDQTENVLPGMSADVDIVIQQKENALIVPVDAVESIGGRYFVRVPKGEGTTSTGANAATGNKAGAGQAAGGTNDSGTSKGAGTNGGMNGSVPGGAAPQGNAPQGNAPQGNAPQGNAQQGGTMPQGNPPQGAAPQGEAPANGGAASGTTGTNASGNGKTGTGSSGNGSTGQRLGANSQRSSGGTWQGGQGNAGYAGQAGSNSQRSGAAGRFSNMMNQANSNFDMKEITVGITTDSQVEVLSGLSAGQTVLIPIVVSSGSTQTKMQMGGFGGMGGFGEMGGFGGAGGGNFVRSKSGGGARTSSAGGGRG